MGDFISSNTYCWIFFYVQSLNIIYRGSNGFGMAFIRFLYIGRGKWTKRHEGNLVFAGLFVLALSVGLIYLYGIENVHNRSTYNSCLGHTENFQVTYFLLPLVLQYIEW
jgi:hypothetical protein